MDALLLLKALILGIVEGLTEFLPISSTGHLILVGDLLDFNDERGKLFTIVIQSGAILAVVWEYRERVLAVARGFGRDRAANRFVLNLFIAFLPLAILGLLFKDAITIDITSMRSAAHEASNLLRVLANENRLLLLCQLSQGEKSVGELEQLLGIRQPTLSQQLGVLRAENLVETRREGKQIIYRVADAHAQKLLETLYRLYCMQDLC